MNLYAVAMLTGLCVLFGSIIAFFCGIEPNIFIVGITIGMVIFAAGGVISIYRD